MKQQTKQQKHGLAGNVLSRRRPATAICRGFLGDDLPPVSESGEAGLGELAHAAEIDAGTPIRVMSSSGGDSEGHAPHGACPSSLPCHICRETLHELSNAMTIVLTNAQMLGWKLPPYSHLKRPARQVERSAQRGAELLKCLMRRLGNEA